MSDLDLQDNIPLYTQTCDLDIAEGLTVEQMRQTHLRPYPEPLIQVDDGIEKNVMVTLSLIHI